MTEHIEKIKSVLLLSLIIFSLFSLLISESNIFKLIKLGYLKFGFSNMNLVINGIISCFILSESLEGLLIILYIASNIFDKVVLF